MNIWQKVYGMATPGGDPCWNCPVCGNGHHVMGIETRNNFTNICKDCGAEIHYEFEPRCGNCIAYFRGRCISNSIDVDKNDKPCKYHKKFA